MCFLDIVTFWYDGVKMVDFGYPGQRGERQPLGRDGLAREGKLLIWRLGWGTGLPHWLHQLAWVWLGGDLGVLGGVIGFSCLAFDGSIAIVLDISTYWYIGILIYEWIGSCLAT